MLLYVTAGEPQEREFRPLHTIPETLAGLYDLGMRHHIRHAVLLHWDKDGWQPMPDWRLDRRVIRLALHGRERLDVNPGDRVAIFGRSSWLWPAAEFAAVGFGCVAVGLSHLLSDGELSAAMAESAPRVAFATDVESARRLMRLRAAAALPQTVIGPDELAAEEAALLPLGRVLELASILDTPERAQNFRACARGVEAGAEACWHFGRGDAGRGPTLVRLTHGQAMALVKRRLAAVPAARHDVGYLPAPEMTLAGRIAYHAFVGDGYTTTALGRTGAADDLALLRPHKAQVSNAWLARAWVEVETSSDSPVRRLSRLLPRVRCLRALDARGPWVRRAIRASFGDRLRCLEVTGTVEPQAAHSLRRTGVAVIERAGEDLSPQEAGA